MVMTRRGTVVLLYPHERNEGKNGKNHDNFFQVKFNKFVSGVVNASGFVGSEWVKWNG